MGTHEVHSSHIYIQYIHFSSDIPVYFSKHGCIACDAVAVSRIFMFNHKGPVINYGYVAECPLFFSEMETYFSHTEGEGGICNPPPPPPPPTPSVADLEGGVVKEVLGARPPVPRHLRISWFRSATAHRNSYI